MPLFDGLDDYQSGRCADCTAHRGAAECRKCEYESSRDIYSPAMIGSADLTYLPRLEAERLTAEWKTKSARRLVDLSETPIFGGRKQKELF